MVDATSDNILLDLPARGSNSGVWDVPVNNNSNSIDGLFGGVQTVSVSNANVTLTAPAGTVSPAPGPYQAQNAAIKFTGTLTANVTITLPLPGYIIVHNLTTGAFTLTFAALLTGQVIATEQGSAHRIYNDGTNVYLTELPPVGTYLDNCDSAVPAWVTACTVPPYLLCNGGTFSSGTYPYLYSKLGNSTTLPDARGRTRFMLGLGTGILTAAGAGIDGTTKLATGGYNGVALSSPNQLPAHTHANTLTDPGHAHSYTITALGSGTGSTPNYFYSSATSAATGAATTGITITNASTGASANIPNAPPGYVGGITMVRAA